MHTSAAAMYSDSRVHPSNTTTDAPEAARPHANRHHRSSDAVLDDAILAAQAGAAAEVAVTKVKWWTSRRARIFGTLLAGAISFSLYRFITGERARYRQELVYVEFIAQTYAAELKEYGAAVAVADAAAAELRRANASCAAELSTLQTHANAYAAGGVRICSEPREQRGLGLRGLVDWEGDASGVQRGYPRVYPAVHLAHLPPARELHLAADGGRTRTPCLAHVSWMH